MENSKILVYDGSFNGFLTSVHIALENNLEVMGLQKNKTNQEGLFMGRLVVATDSMKAKCIWKSIEKKSHAAIRMVYFAFLSEADGVDFMLYQYIGKLYGMLDINDMEQLALVEARISKLALQVDREKSYIESTVDLQEGTIGSYFVELGPRFNILPLISRHFRYRYPKQPWIIFDGNRQYGIYYNGLSLEIIPRETKDKHLMRKMDIATHLENNYRTAI